MSEQDQVVKFGWSWTQKGTYLAAAGVVSLVIIFFGGVFKGTVGLALFMVIGVLLGLLTFHLSSGWGFRLDLGRQDLGVIFRAQRVTVPLDKVGLLVRGGGFLYPTLWLVLKNAGVGAELPKKMDDATRELIESYQHRNPGKKLTYVTIPGGHLSSLSGFVNELKRRIPPLTVDSRLSK